MEAYDPRDIEDMEAEYEGQHSTREERRSGQYGGPQSYHAVPSPPPAGLEVEEELAGPTAGADASPSTEARLLAGSPQPRSPRVEPSLITKAFYPSPTRGTVCKRRTSKEPKKSPRTTRLLTSERCFPLRSADSWITCQDGK